VFYFRFISHVRAAVLFNVLKKTLKQLWNAEKLWNAVSEFYFSFISCCASHLTQRENTVCWSLSNSWSLIMLMFSNIFWYNYLDRVTCCDVIMSLDIVTSWRRKMLLLLLLIADNGRSLQTTIPSDVTTDTDDVCISRCTCWSTAIVCKRDNVLTSFPVLSSTTASTISDM